MVNVQKIKISPLLGKIVIMKSNTFRQYIISEIDDCGGVVFNTYRYLLNKLTITFHVETIDFKIVSGEAVFFKKADIDFSKIV